MLAVSVNNQFHCIMKGLFMVVYLIIEIWAVSSHFNLIFCFSGPTDPTFCGVTGTRTYLFSYVMMMLSCAHPPVSDCMNVCISIAHAQSNDSVVIMAN